MDTKQVYCYSQTTMEYLNMDTAYLDPLETKKIGEKKYIIPAYSTISPPPVLSDNEVAVFDLMTSAWCIKPDFRGQVFYSKETGFQVEIKDIGPVTDNLTENPKPEGFYIWKDEDWVIDKTETQNALIFANTQKRDELSIEAENQIILLERKVKLKRATDEEIALLNRLYNYTIDLSELDLSKEHFDWIKKPILIR